MKPDAIAFTEMAWVFPRARSREVSRERFWGEVVNFTEVSMKTGEMFVSTYRYIGYSNFSYSRGGSTPAHIANVLASSTASFFEIHNSTSSSDSSFLTVFSVTLKPGPISLERAS